MIKKRLDYDQEESRLRSISVSTTIEKVLDHDREKKFFFPLALDLRYRDASRLRWFFNLVLMHLFILLHQANLLPLLYATILYLLQEMAGKDPSTRTPTRPKLPAPRRPSPPNAPSGSTSEPVDASRPGKYLMLTPSQGYRQILHSS